MTKRTTTTRTRVTGRMTTTDYRCTTWNTNSQTSTARTFPKSYSTRTLIERRVTKARWAQRTKISEWCCMGRSRTSHHHICRMIRSPSSWSRLGSSARQMPAIRKNSPSSNSKSITETHSIRNRIAKVRWDCLTFRPINTTRTSSQHGPSQISTRSTKESTKSKTILNQFTKMPAMIRCPASPECQICEVIWSKKRRNWCSKLCSRLESMDTILWSKMRFSSWRSSDKNRESERRRCRGVNLGISNSARKAKLRTNNHKVHNQMLHTVARTSKGTWVQIWGSPCLDSGRQ